MAVGHVGQVLDALGAEHRERHDLAGLDVLDGLADLQAGGVDLAAEHGGERGSAAVEGHGLAVDAGAARRGAAQESCAPVPTPVVPKVTFSVAALRSSRFL